MRTGIGPLLGAASLTTSLAFHRSESGVVLGRWSPFVTAILAGFAVVTLWLGIRTFRRGGDGRHGTWHWARPRVWLELAAVTYGAGYLAGAIADPGDAGHLLDLNITGSRVPVEILFGWLAAGFLLVAALTLLPRLPATWRNPALLITSVLVAVLALEGVARGVALFNPQVQGFPTYRARLWVRRFFHLNAAGFRDRDHARVAASRVHRLLIVGDSFGAGYGMDNPDDRFGNRLGDLLSRETGSAWEVIHCAKPDTNTLQHLQFLKECLRFDPELVILLYVFNDINYLIPQRSASLASHSDTPLERLQPIRVLFLNSFAFEELYVRARPLAYAREGLPREVNAYRDSSLLSRHLADVGRFVQTARNAGARIGIVPFSILLTVSEPDRERYGLFVAAARRAGLPVWRADSVFSGMSFESLRVAPLDAHPNARANSLLASAVLGRALSTLAEPQPDQARRQPSFDQDETLRAAPARAMSSSGSFCSSSRESGT